MGTNYYTSSIVAEASTLIHHEHKKDTKVVLCAKALFAKYAYDIFEDGMATGS